MTTGMAIAVAGALPGVAAADGCGPVPKTKAFAQFGDANDYFLASGGAFDSLTWSSSGSPSLVAGLNPFNLGKGVFAVRLDKDEAVTSSTFCVDNTTPHLRFVARTAGGGQLDVEVKIYVNGRVTDSSSGSVSPSDHSAWAPSHNVELKTSSLAHGQSALATVTVHSQGTWFVDDVFIDPYRR